MANQFDGVEARAVPAQIAAEMERLVVYADAQERKVSELQAALDTRVIIEQALGILAERFERSRKPSKCSARQRVTRDGK